MFDEEKRETIRREVMVLSCFTSFVVTVPRRSKQAHNSTAHAERAVGAVSNYYKHMHGRARGAGLGLDFTRTLRSVTRGVRMLYPSIVARRIPLLADHMRAIRAAVNLDYLKKLTYWALWTSQWQWVMRSRDVLIPAHDKARR